MIQVTATDRRDLRRRTYDAVSFVQNVHGWSFRLASGATLVTWDDYTVIHVGAIR